MEEPLKFQSQDVQSERIIIYKEPLYDYGNQVVHSQNRARKLHTILREEKHLCSQITYRGSSDVPVKSTTIRSSFHSLP